MGQGRSGGNFVFHFLKTKGRGTRKKKRARMGRAPRKAVVEDGYGPRKPRSRAGCGADLASEALPTRCAQRTSKRLAPKRASGQGAGGLAGAGAGSGGRASNPRAAALGSQEPALPACTSCCFLIRNMAASAWGDGSTAPRRMRREKQARGERLCCSAMAPMASSRSHWERRRDSSSGVQMAPEPSVGRGGWTLPARGAAAGRLPAEGSEVPRPSSRGERGSREEGCRSRDGGACGNNWRTWC